VAGGKLAGDEGTGRQVGMFRRFRKFWRFQRLKDTVVGFGGVQPNQAN